MRKPKRFVVAAFNHGWIVWDNLTARVSDGIYSVRDDAVVVAAEFNKNPESGDRNWFAEGGWLEDFNSKK